MGTELIDAYSPFAAGMLLIAGFGAWVFIHSNRSYRLRWLLIPLALGVGLGSANMYDARLGFAAPTQLPEKFVYLGHHVVVIRDQKAGLEVWGQVRSTRLYRIPYSKAMEKALQAAQERAQGGGAVVMHRKSAGRPGEAGKPDSSDLEPYESNIILPSEADPKAAS